MRGTHDPPSHFRTMNCWGPPPLNIEFFEEVECPMRDHTTPPAKDLTLGLLSSIFEFCRAGGRRHCPGCNPCGEWESVAPGGGAVCVLWDKAQKHTMGSLYIRKKVDFYQSKVEIYQTILSWYFNRWKRAFYNHISWSKSASCAGFELVFFRYPR